MKKVKKFLTMLGPGFITGAADDDPSGIATYSQTGAQFGYSQLWIALFSTPFMSVVQEMCGRIGIVTGKGLAGVIRKHYSKTILYFCVALLLIANTINIGADLGAMAAAGGLLIPIPFIFWLVGITVLTLVLEIFVSYKLYSKVLKYLALSLLTYVISAFIIKQDWSKIAYSTFVPSISLSKEYLMNIVALLGTNLSPYLFFWQAGEEVEEQVDEGKQRVMGHGIPKINIRDIRKMRVDTTLGMVFSNLVMFFIIVTTASTLNAHGITEVKTAEEAAKALRPIAGNFAFFLFAAGVIGTGLLAVPVLSGSASYALSETFGWKEGLYRKLKQAHGFYGVITIATLVGLLVNYLNIAPFRLLYYTAILNGLVAPVLMVMIMLITRNEKIMGKYTNNLPSNIMGILITGLMFIAGIAMIYTVFVS